MLAPSLVNVWFGGPSGIHRPAFDAAIEVGAPVGGPGLVVWGLGQPFEQYAPSPEVGLEHARQCAMRASVLTLQWGTPSAEVARIVHEARRLGRPLRAIDLALLNDTQQAIEDIATWLHPTRPSLYVVGGEQEPPLSPYYRRAKDLVAGILRKFPRPREP